MVFFFWLFGGVGFVGKGIVLSDVRLTFVVGRLFDEVQVLSFGGFGLAIWMYDRTCKA